MKNILLSVYCGFALISCNLKDTGARPENDEMKTYTSFPSFPELKEYSKKPIIGTQQGNFIVTDEFLGNSLKYKNYAERIELWKGANGIK